MSPSNGDSQNDARVDTAASDEGEWFDRHARVEARPSDRWVRADPPSDDWHARHSRTKRRP